MFVWDLGWSVMPGLRLQLRGLRVEYEGEGENMKVSHSLNPMDEGPHSGSFIMLRAETPEEEAYLFWYFNHGAKKEASKD